MGNARDLESKVPSVEKKFVCSAYDCQDDLDEQLAKFIDLSKTHSNAFVWCSIIVASNW